MLTVRVWKPRSLAGHAWNQAQYAVSMIAAVFVLLKIAGVISWSWWWVLSPLWVNGILLAAGLGVVVTRIALKARATRRLSSS